MIKLIASDLDGTLLQNGAQRLSDDTLELIRRVIASGIRFVATSGRQYPNMKRIFREIWDDVTYIAENGSVIVHHDEVLDKTVIPQDLARELILDLQHSELCDAMVSGVHSIYMQPKERTRPYEDFILHELKNTTTFVDELACLNEEIIKISALVYGDRAADFAPDLQQKWSGKFHVAVAGKEWVDFTLTNKGEALEKMKRRLSVTKDETMAFGDNFNDASMFAAVGHSYAMAAADPEVRKMARHTCDSVESVLRELIG
jgi:Cof subfamily protein (haloacid dehalogenase superfamily)